MTTTIDDGGFGPIRLGMTWEAALAAGMTPTPVVATSCDLGEYGDTIVVGRGGSVVSVTLPVVDGVSTQEVPDGVTVGRRDGVVVYLRAGPGIEC